MFGSNENRKQPINEPSPVCKIKILKLGLKLRPKPTHEHSTPLFDLTRQVAF